jgi:preprotein translocase subunit SecG
LWSFDESFQEIGSEIDLRKQNGDEGFVSKRDDSKAAVKVLVLKLTFLLLSIFMASRIYVALSAGVISWKGNDEYYLAEQPQTFYFVFMVHVLFLLVCLFLAFSNRHFKKHDVL